MAEEVQKETSEKKEKKAPREKKPLDLDEKVTVKSISVNQVDFPRKADGVGGSVTIMPMGKVRLSRNEIIAQINDNNNLLAGVDRKGSHATLYIDDAPTRIELGFESEDGTVKQAIFSDELLQDLFAIKNQEDFENAFKKAIVTRAEKSAVMPAIQRLGLNDYYKIRFAEKYTHENLI